MNHESERQVTIEDLLRVKRAERPRPEFWADFDRELRAKQLAALVEKRPWWRSLPRALGGIARYHLPLGATAVLALTLISVRDYQPVLPNPAIGISDVDAPRVDDMPVVELPAVSVAAPVEQVEAAPAARPVPSIAGLSAASAGELARMVPTISVENRTVAVDDVRPSARSIAENRAAAEAMLGTPNTGFETRALPAKAMPQEPLAQMSNPAETRRSRYAAVFAAAVAANASAPSAPTARVARRLSDEQLYDSIHRFGASGNSVSIKF